MPLFARQQAVKHLRFRSLWNVKKSSLLFMIKGYVEDLEPVRVVNLKNMPGCVYILRGSPHQHLPTLILKVRTFQAIVQSIIF